MLTSKQRAFLRGEAQTLEPVIYVGKGGVGDALLGDAEAALRAKELIKGTVLENCPISAREAADTLAQSLHADPVQVIGRRFVLYRESENPEARRFDLLAFESRPETPKKRNRSPKTGTAAAKKPPVKPGYRRAMERKKEEERRKLLKAEKAAFFREKARAERLAARGGSLTENSAGSGAGEARYTVIRRPKG